MIATNVEPASARREPPALAYMTLSALLFALMNLFARLASSSASWASVGAVRALVGASVALAVARMRGSSLAVGDRRGVLWRSVLGTAAMVSTFYALSSRALPLGDTATLLNLSPVFLAVLSPLVLGERTSRGIVAALGLSMIGIMLIFRPALLFGAAAAPTGAAAGPSTTTTAMVAVAAALFTSLAMMFLRRVGQRESTEAIAFYFSLFAAVTMVGFALFDPRLPRLRDVGFMVAAGLSAGFGQLAMTRAYTLERAARVGALSYVSVLASALLGALLLGERPDAIAIGGMILVAAGGVVVTLSPRT